MINKNITLTFLYLLISVFNINSQEKTEVLLLATYHFGGTTTDEVKVAGDDILGDKKQQELEEVIGKLKKYKTEKIYVEQEPNRQKYWDSIYTAYRNGQNIQIENEIFQLGIKLAEKSNLNQGITCVDWHVRPPKTFSEKEYDKLLVSMYNYDTPDEPESVYETKAMERIKKFNQEIPSLEMFEVLKTFNEEEWLNLMFYGNITSYLDIDKYDINVFWSQKNMIRNVNIYQNIIQDIMQDKPKRVIIIFGAGHIKALRNYLEVHPQIEIVDTLEYLK